MRAIFDRKKYGQKTEMLHVEVRSTSDHGGEDTGERHVILMKPWVDVVEMRTLEKLKIRTVDPHGNERMHTVFCENEGTEEEPYLALEVENSEAGMP